MGKPYGWPIAEINTIIMRYRTILWLVSIFTTLLGGRSFGQGYLNPYEEQGVEINEVRWATRNLAAPGRFAPSAEDAGWVYRWCSAEGRSASDEGAQFVSPDSLGWDRANNPSPGKWGLPALWKVQELLDTAKVADEWIYVNGVGGRRFTDRATESSVFLPAANYCIARTDSEEHLYLRIDRESARISSDYVTDLFSVRSVEVYYSGKQKDDYLFQEFSEYEAIFAENPELRESIEGRYVRSDVGGCTFVVDIFHEEGTWYTFKAEVGDKHYEGDVGFSAHKFHDKTEYYLFLSGIPWISFLGPLDDEGLPISEEGMGPVYGLDFYWVKDELFFQNCGNSGNYYLKTECDDKYINLMKESVYQSMKENDAEE